MQYTLKHIVIFIKCVELSPSLCRMDYDVVLKFENYRQEERYLLRSLGLGSAVEQKWENR